MLVTKLRVALVGNGPYANCGCEAIVRGTMTILRGVYDTASAVVGTFGPVEVVLEQGRQEVDPDVSHFPLFNSRAANVRRWSRHWWWNQVLRRLGRSAMLDYQALEREVTSVDVAMEIGGDNYSLDYGLPYNFMAVDNWIRSRKIPLILWGASVGPFEANPAFKRKILEHLRKMDLIVVRESASLNYLTSCGLTENVRVMADPAFVMEPTEPKDCLIDREELDEAVGLSLSPLMARYITGGDLKKWTLMAADLVKEIVGRTGRKVVLIPHVNASYNIWSDDTRFLSNVLDLVTPDKRRQVLLLPRLSAAEYKWYIGRSKVFIGARTHATIASLSSCVPTISLAYSIKARGLNADVLNTMDYCIEPSSFSTGLVVERLFHALDHYADIRSRLEKVIPEFKQKALEAGRFVREILANGNMRN